MTEVLISFLLTFQRLGLDERIDELNVIHVAGTKGKVCLLHITRAVRNSRPRCSSSPGMGPGCAWATGVHVRDGGEHPALLRLQDRTVHIAPPVGRAREDPAQRVRCSSP